MAISKTSILAETVARQGVVAANSVVLLDNFPEQNAFILDSARYIDAQCSRRAGKTSGLARRFFKTMEKHPKSQSIYLGLTL